MMDEIMRRVNAVGWGGVAIWRVGDVFMGCLVLPPGHPLPPGGLLDTDTNLWDYQASAALAAELLARKAERIGPPQRGE